MVRSVLVWATHRDRAPPEFQSFYDLSRLQRKARLLYDSSRLSEYGMESSSMPL